jgi:hypothetical protein
MVFGMVSQRNYKVQNMARGTLLFMLACCLTRPFLGAWIDDDFVPFPNTFSVIERDYE